MDNFKWETIDTKYLLKNQYLSLRSDTCRMPDGRIIDPYFVLEFSDWVNVVAITEEGQVILIRQFRQGLGKTCLEIPSGILDEGENPVTGVKRELEEETGYISNNITKIGTVSANPANHNNLTHCYLAMDCQKNSVQNLDETEDIEVVLKPLDDVIGMLKEGEFVNAMCVSSLFLALSRLNRMKP